MKQKTTTYDKIFGMVKNQLNEHIKSPFEIRLWQDSSYAFGEGNPLFTIHVLNKNGLSALSSFDQLKFCEAYMNGDIDIEGDIYNLLALRQGYKDKHPLHYLGRRILPLLIGQVKTDKKAILRHYEYDDDFFLSFLDPTRCYSQAIFERDDETLEKAQRRKLDFAIEACNLKKGDRVLDVGGGWGTFCEHAGLRGIRVTSLTISPHSEKYLKNLIQRKGLDCSVEFCDFYNYSNTHPFDAIVILGVMEHLPDYKSVVRQVGRLLRPGGVMYFDSCSDRKKYDQPTFVSKYVYPGNHTNFCLHDFLFHVSKSDLELDRVYNDRHSYYLTSIHWAKNLESARNEIEKRWGKRLYRLFRIYLWGVAEAMFRGSIDAYRVVLKRPVTAESVQGITSAPGTLG